MEDVEKTREVLIDELASLKAELEQAKKDVSYWYDRCIKVETRCTEFKTMVGALATIANGVSELINKE